MSGQTLQPPRGGMAPPQVATLPDGTTLALRPLAEEIARRYASEFPDERARYGDAVHEWCTHDNQHILNWAALASAGSPELLDQQVEWLARVLAARSFPVERLERDLAIAASVVRELRPDAQPVADALEATLRRRRGG